MAHWQHRLRGFTHSALHRAAVTLAESVRCGPQHCLNVHSHTHTFCLAVCCAVFFLVQVHVFDVMPVRTHAHVFLCVRAHEHVSSGDEHHCCDVMWLICSGLLLLLLPALFGDGWGSEAVPLPPWCMQHLLLLLLRLHVALRLLHCCCSFGGCCCCCFFCCVSCCWYCIAGNLPVFGHVPLHYRSAGCELYALSLLPC
jgi:hypothetical protein